MPADNDHETIGSAEATVTTQEAGSRRGQRDAAAAALAGVDHEPGAAKPDPILVADGIVRQFGGLTRGRRRPRRDPARCDHRPDRPQRRRQDDLLQPAHRLRPARRGHLVVRRPVPQGRGGAQGGPAGHGAHLPAHQGAVQADRDREHAARRDRPEGRERLHGAVPGHLGRPGAGDHRAGRRPAGPVQAGRQARGLRRQPVRRPAQAARDGPGADGRPRDGDAGRADGRGEPGPDPVAARPRQGPARGRHDGAVRRARHGHGARHLRLGDRDGPGQGDRRGSAGRRHGRPAGHRRLPRVAPRRGADRGGRAARARRGRGGSRAGARRGRGAEP